MSDLVIHTHDLPDLTVAQLANLPPARLQELDVMLTEFQNWLKASRERMHAALEQRYGEQARQTLMEAGQDFGTTHLADGAIRITVEIPKRVRWDQAQMAEIARRIVASGDQLDQYIDVEFSVPETRFNAWPETLKQPFKDARTVKAGKAVFRIAPVQENDQ